MRVERLNRLTRLLFKEVTRGLWGAVLLPEGYKEEGRLVPLVVGLWVEELRLLISHLCLWCLIGQLVGSKVKVGQGGEEAQ